MSVANDQPVPPPPGKSRLITSSDDEQELSDVRETDARTALLRGVKEYLEGLKITYGSGREARFKKVYEAWAEPESIIEFPSAIAYAPDTGTYDGDSFSTQIVKVQDAGQQVISLRLLCELVQTITVEVYSTDPVERMALAAMLEDAFSPVEFMSGFRLELPHYFNARASYLPMSITYADDAEGAQKRLRRVIVTLDGTVPVYRFLGPVPKLQPRFKLDLAPPGS